MSLRRLMKLSIPVPVLFLLVLPLHAQTSPAHFIGGYDTRGAAIGPDSASQATIPRKITDAGAAESTRRYASASSRDSDKVRSVDDGCCSSSSSEQQPLSSTSQQVLPRTKTDPPGEAAKASSALIGQRHERTDRNLDIYYRNRTEFSLDVGWHSINVPFIFDFAVGDSYNRPPLNYTVVPIVASLRWHVTNVGWKWILRGNTDFTFSGSITAIPRGPETHYYAFNFGIRRNFVYRNWKVVPYWEQRGGAGIIDAREPLGVLFAQGQDLTFTYNMGAGIRYNIDSKYSFSAGLNYMHISNAYLSQPQFYNYGINVYGPMFGLNVRLGKPHHHASE